MYALKLTSVWTLRLARHALKYSSAIFAMHESEGLPFGLKTIGESRGIEVGDQALGNLRARGRVTACQPPNLLPLPLRERQQIWLLPLP